MSKAAAMRWLNANVGKQIDTVQTYPDGRTWIPGPRTLVLHGKTKFALNNSFLSLDRITEVTATSVTGQWFDCNTDELIHTTKYSLSENDAAN